MSYEFRYPRFNSTLVVLLDYWILGFGGWSDVSFESYLGEVSCHKKYNDYICYFSSAQTFVVSGSFSWHQSVWSLFEYSILCLLLSVCFKSPSPKLGPM